MQRRDEKKNTELTITFINLPECHYTYTIRMTLDIILDILMYRKKDLFTKIDFSIDNPDMYISCVCDISDFHTKYVLELVKVICKEIIKLDPRCSISFILRDIDSRYCTSFFINIDD